MLGDQMQDSANFSTVWRAESFSVSKHEQARIERVLRDKFAAAVKSRAPAPRRPSLGA